ncbi:MAG: glycosyltransferase family 4 protein [Oscillospiraceae bacterium]|nr:glycosyltransferase family 4 protein [Oscillospiraceae bacterium]
MAGWSEDGNQKRILVVCQHFWPESFRINEICESLSEKGIQIDVLCGMPNYPEGVFYKGYNYFKPRTEYRNGIKIMRVGEIPQWKKGGNLFVALNYLFFPFASLFSIPRFLFKKKYDCVFTYSLSPVFMGFPGIIYSKLRNVKSVCYILDYWPDSLYSVIPLSNRVLRKIIKSISFWHYKNSDIVLAPSKGVLNKLRTDTGDENSFFLPQSCSEVYETLVYNSQLHGRHGGRFNLVFAGNIGPAQSLETVIEAIALLKSDNPGLADSFRLLILGGGMSKETIVKKMQELNLSDCVFFEGFVPEKTVLEYHELADALFVSLSDNPLFSMMIPAKVQSYIAAGKPILAALSGEGADVIREADCGLVCPSGDPQELAKAISTLMSLTQQERDRMGKNGKEYYNANYKHGLFIERLIEILL